MEDGFADLIDRSNAFFAGLAANNTRDWFEPRKDDYVAGIRKPAELLADLLAGDIARKTGRAVTPKVFRIYRDVRFSRDKTPYNTHLHLMWSAPGATAPAWFFGSSPDYLVLGTGVMGLSGPALARYRAFVDRQGDALAAAIAAAERAVGAEVSDWGPEPLKRVPKPYGQDHPHADLMKRKALALSAPLGEGWRKSGLVPAINARVDALMPVWRLLDGEFG